MEGEHERVIVAVILIVVVVKNFKEIRRKAETVHEDEGTGVSKV